MRENEELRFSGIKKDYWENSKRFAYSLCENQQDHKWTGRRRVPFDKLRVNCNKSLIALPKLAL
jgi:hypothetical protein